MLRKLMVGLLATALLATGASMAIAGGGDDGDDDDGGQVIRLKSTVTSELEVDHGDNGLGPGDRFVFADDLSRDGEKVGEDAGECVVARVKGETSTVNCVVTLSLPGGQIAVQGLVTFTAEQEPFTVAITGGTGRYRDADGEVSVEPVSETEDRLIIHLD